MCPGTPEGGLPKRKMRVEMPDSKAKSQDGSGPKGDGRQVKRRKFGRQQKMCH